jgi:hypothetical protein
MWQRLWLGFTPEEILRPSPPAQAMSAATRNGDPLSQGKRSEHASGDAVDITNLG